MRGRSESCLTLHLYDLIVNVFWEAFKAEYEL